MLFDPQAWASLFTLTVLEVVLSIDNLAGRCQVGGGGSGVAG